MSLTRRNVGQVTRVPMKASTTINMGGIVCADATGYAVAGSDASGLRFIGIAAKGVANAGANGAAFVPVWTQGVFKMTGVGLAITDQGKPMYAGGAATVVPSSTYGIEVGSLSQYISATSGWVTIGGGAGGGDVPSAGIADGAVTAVKLASNAVETAKINAAAVTKAKLASGISADIKGILAVNNKTTSLDENIAGLSSAITLALELQTDLTNHFASATRHTTGQQASTSFATLPITTFGELLAATGAMLTAYAAHNADAILAAAWAYHSEQATSKALVSDVTPTTLAQAITRLNDLKAKYNDHEDEETGHNTTASVAADQVAASDAANGVAILVTATGVASGDFVVWSILDDGTGNVKGVSALAGTNVITFTFSADPQGDTIISYAVFRTTT